MFHIKDQKVVRSDNKFSGYIPYQHQYPFPFATFNSFKPYGQVCMYAVDDSDLSMQNRAFFCDNRCAHSFAKENKFIMLYYDESLHSVRGITPHMVQINKILGGNDLRGLTYGWNKEWIIPQSSFTDLKKYNVNIKFPKLSVDQINLHQLKLSDTLNYSNLFADDCFRSTFFGSNFFLIKNTKQIEDHINAMTICYKHRLGIEWIIKKKKLIGHGETMGFIRMYCTNQSDPGNWYLEFGLKKKYQNQGHMSDILHTVLNWARKSGLDKAYAICETYNFGCEKLLKKIPNTRYSKIQAYDQYSGSREMYRFIIDL